MENPASRMQYFNVSTSQRVEKECSIPITEQLYTKTQEANSFPVESRKEWHGPRSGCCKYRSERK